ncbi:bifunctional heptose 7-phosphate kinase/heptose 1-phosphate adenyltransferase [Tunicatimonas pelagia]|uniref:bifunctional heptose 7-phosphate kinase/heptose 1-phosphate adenyltransferase n=1 Tax=Tunicatimonas pelagia TaxID=931531 RepID=UPI0026655331|nr:bifunctional ADP-heptose synthase [Tunicatimonas pelagia]WKN45285.1 bifunctional ADP-heptose synthase [Tunicatimonas pelagia]
MFEDFRRLKVLIVGDVMLDAYVWGSVHRISPEAPVPILNVKKRESRLGGAANVALNVQSLGATPVLCAVIGEDASGEAFTQLLEKHQIGTEGIVRSQSRPTTVKERIIGGGQQMLRIDAEHNQVLSAPEQEMLQKAIQPLLPQTDVIIFQDYDKGVLNESLIQWVQQQADQYNIPTTVDPKRRNFLHYRHATLFKPNLKELKEGLLQETIALHQEEYELQPTIREASTVLRQRLQHKVTLITLSEKGVFVDDTQESIFIPAHIREISDVSGAGDTVISIAALCLALQLPSPLMASLANLGGGIVCEYTGVVPIDAVRLLEEATEHLAL